MGSVRLDAKAFRDPRVLILAAELSIDKFSALGRLAHLWSHCTETCSYELNPQLVNAAMSHDGAAEALIAAELATKLDSKLLRIHGTNGRIEWLERKRKACRLGGQKRAEQASREDGGRFTPAEGGEEPARPEKAPKLVKTSRPPKPPPGVSPEALECADHFRARILDWFPECPDLTEIGWRRRRTRWAGALGELCTEQIGFAKIRSVIDWACADQFWQTHIITPKALRKHFARLLGSANRPKLVADHGHSKPTPKAEFPETGQEGIAF